ncbi:protein of unknown function [Nitrospira japonica]|uniref:Oxygen sensor histidine kinase NreB n=1 Tax=Nitrospira japonica TaxID=1325564 RepID=A0A1W1I2S9_9BACT|nr:response regulator [Nitrospira japonica]SLM47308.1 protein of unknown function [Nitrospira japonica]
MSDVQATILNVNERNGQRYERRSMLERAGYRVLDAACGADVLRVLQDVRPELVLLDIDLPDISGFDLCRQIKNRPELTDTMVLHVSAAEFSGSDRALGLEMGSDGYLVEPIEEQELLAGVRSLLRLRARQRENEGLLARLRRSEEQFRGLFEQAAVGMCVLGPDGRFLRVNERLGVIAGRTERELMDRELRDLTDPADRREHDSQVGKLLLGRLTEVSLDQRLLQPDGRTIWTTLTLSIQWDAGGRIQSLIGVVEDIDARKRAELELRNHAVRQQLLSEAMDRLLRVDDPARVMHEIFASLRSTLELDIFLDYDARPELDSIELSTWAGIPEQALAPLRLLKFGQALCGTSAASRQPIVVDHLQSVSDPKALRVQATGSNAYVCFPLIVGDRLLGTLAFASSRRSSFESDELDLLEAVSHSVAMAKERRRLLQEARQRAAQLTESEERLRFATEGAGMGTWDVDLKTGRVVWDRQNARLLGYASDGCTSSARQWWNLVHKDDRSAVREAVAAARDSRGFYRCEHRILRADTGETRWLASFGRIHYDDAGHPSRFAGAAFDVTERRETETQRLEWTRELERRIGERTKELVHTHDRLRALAHDLTLTEQRERQRIAEELHDYLAQMLVVIRLKIRQADKMVSAEPASSVLDEADRLIDQCLTYTRTLVAELMPPTLRQFGLAPGLRWLGEQMEHQGLRVEVDVPAMTPPLPEDHTALLYQCVRELLFNVLKHAGTKAAAVRMTQDDGGRLQIVVRDEGFGCDPESVMESRGDKFGLFSVRERMEALGGWMELESKAGGGTTVTLGLSADVPLNRPPSTQPAGTRRDAAGGDAVISPSFRREPAPSHPSRHPSPIRVLLVDDHAMVRQGLRSVLDGYSDLTIIAEAGDGEEAVALAKLLHPDLIVMDVNLPRLDGIEATRRIRTDRPDALIVGLSVNQAEHVVSAMRAAGAAAFLTKESAADHLYETIEAVVGR